MNDKYFQALADQWLPLFRDAAMAADQHSLHRTIFLFAKDVSRDTRHRAYDIAQRASRDIMNMSESE